jgi:glucuronoarabinoxylan endo-1,4-beta-xylanase
MFDINIGGRMTTSIKSLAFVSLICFFAPVQADVIAIDHTTKYQTIDGFGGFGGNDYEYSGGTQYTAAWSQMIAQDLGLTIQREFLNDTPIETPTDTAAVNQGNISGLAAPRFLGIVKSLHDAGVPTFFFSHLSPPAFMKSNGEVSNGGTLLPTQYANFASYCAAIVKLYKRDAGVDLPYMSLQNEPLFVEPYASCVYTAQTLRDIIKVVGQKFAAEGITTKIMAPEALPAQWDGLRSFFTTICGDTSASKYVGVLAVHNYAADGVGAGTTGAGEWVSMASMAKQYGKRLWQTETSGYALTWNGAMTMATSIYMALKFGNVNGWVYYRLGASSTNSDALTQNGNKTVLYTALKNFSRYIRPGAVRINATQSDTTVGVIAFMNSTDATITAVVLNPNAIAKTISFTGTAIPSHLQMYTSSATKSCVDDGSVSSSSITIPANSLVTLVGAGYNPSVSVGRSGKSRTAGTAASGKSASGTWYGLDGRRIAVMSDASGCHKPGATGVCIRTAGSHSQAAKITVSGR